MKPLWVFAEQRSVALPIVSVTSPRTVVYDVLLTQ
jgi:hypothetical protein